MRRHTLRAIAIAMLAGAAIASTAAGAQQSTCTSCETEERDRVLRRYQQEIQRVSREIENIQRQLASSESVLDTAAMRRLNERLRRTVQQLSSVQMRQAAQLQSLAGKRRGMVSVAPRASHWTTHEIDGYIGVLWSAKVQIEKPKTGEMLWTFYDYPHVEAVERESPAERAGIQSGDMILAFDGKDLKAGKIPMNTVLRPGKTVAVRLTRDNRTRSVNVRVEERPRAVAFARTPRPSIRVEVRPGELIIEPPEPVEVAMTPPPAEAPFPALAPGWPGPDHLRYTVGAEMIALDETLGEPYGTDHGLLIVGVGPRTPAARAGIQKGDILLTVEGRELRSVPALIRAVDRADKSELRLELLRKGERKVVVMKW